MLEKALAIRIVFMRCCGASKVNGVIFHILMEEAESCQHVIALRPEVSRVAAIGASTALP